MTGKAFHLQRLLVYSPALFVLLIIIILGIYLSKLRFEYQEQELRHDISNHLSVIRAKLEGNINSEAQLIKGLVVAISTEPNLSQARFNALSDPLFSQHSQLRNIAAAPDLVIRYMHPYSGNEAAVGLDYRKNKLQYEAVKKAIDAKSLVIAGPVKLVQGGQGFIARIPIFIGKNKDKLWGIVSAVIDAEKFLEKSGVTDPALHFEIALRGKDASGERGAFFFGDAEIQNSSPVYMDVSLPHGSWQIMAIPKGGWPAHQSNRGFFIFTMVIVGLFILVPMVMIARMYEKHRESEELLNGLFELSPIGIALNDYATGDFVKTNSALVEPTGYTEKEFVNLSYWDLTPIEYEDQEKIQLENLKKYHRYGPYEKEYIRKDGTRYPVLLRGVLVTSTSGKKMIWSMVEDITERKQNEKVKSEFISTVSHELRTPLTSISGAVSLVLGDVFGELPEQAKETLKLAKSNSDRLSFLINDLLDIEKLYAKKVKFDWKSYDIVELVKNSVKTNQSYANKFNVEIKFLPEIKTAYVYVDEQRLQQVLSNLISNAAKFSPENHHVDVSVKQKEHKVRVEVSDYGKGIPEEFYERIFSKFSQADSTDTRKRGGTGLGLAISKELIEQMKGSIGFYSKQGEGTTFYFELNISSRAKA